ERLDDGDPRSGRRSRSVPRFPSARAAARRAAHLPRAWSGHRGRAVEDPGVSRPSDAPRAPDPGDARRRRPHHSGHRQGDLRGGPRRAARPRGDVGALTLEEAPAGRPCRRADDRRVAFALDAPLTTTEATAVPDAARRSMTPQDITRIMWVSDPQISPDGSRVAFVATTLSEEKDEYLSQIWLAETNGGSRGGSTAGPKRDTEPRWSPDGQRLAFVSDREAKKKGQLYVMRVDGGEPVKLTDMKAGVTNPVWAPDGTRLCVVSRVGGWEEPDSEEEKQKSRPARVITSLKYKYNGEGFTYDRRPHLFVVAADGGTPMQITDGDFIHGDPTWSPDGRLIAFTSARHDERDLDDVRDTWGVAREGGEPRRVTDTGGPVGLVSFAPDGRSLAYVGRRTRNDFGGNMRVFTVLIDGGAPSCLTSSFDRSCAPLPMRPLWSPDARFITFAAEDRGALSLYRVAVSEGAVPELIVGGDRVVTGFSGARDGSLAFAATDPVTPAEIFVSRSDGSAERRLTDLNAAWRAEVALSRPERIRFTRDGFEVDAWVMKPSGPSSGAKRPGLLNIHGGPHAQYGWGFFDEFQVYAGAGYVVVYANPRGSQGYGEAFTRAVIRDWGGGDFADVMAALDEAIMRR